MPLFINNNSNNNSNNNNNQGIHGLRRALGCISVFVLHWDVLPMLIQIVLADAFRINDTFL